MHSLTWHPHTSGRAYEAGGGGAAFSTDAGESWRPADEGRDRHYTWSVTVDPGDAECWYVSASTGPFAAHGRRDPQAYIYRRRNGQPWQPLAGGLPEPLPAMPYALLATDGRLFVGLADGQLWQSRNRGDTWTPLRLAGDRVVAVLALARAADRERSVRGWMRPRPTLGRPNSERGSASVQVVHTSYHWSRPTARLFAGLSRLRGRRICDRLPPVAAAGLHKRSIPRRWSPYGLCLSPAKCLGGS